MINEIITVLTTQLNRLDGAHLLIALIVIIIFIYLHYKSKDNNPEEEKLKNTHINETLGNNNKSGHDYGHNNDFGNNNSFGDTINNHPPDSIATHISLNNEVDEKIIAFGDIFFTLMNKSNLEYSDVESLKNKFVSLLRAINFYNTSMKNRNITTDIEDFYNEDLIKILDLTIELNNFIENSSFNITKISKDSLKIFLPKNETITNKYSEIMELYNKL